MKKVYLMLLTVLFAAITNAQVTGTKTIGVDYPTIAAAVTDLNTVGVGAGGATINVPAGYTETAPSNGYVLGTTLLNASLRAANQLIIQKNGAGADPVITAFTGGSSLTNDGIFKIAGADYVTINGIDLKENVANSGAALMEWGYALVNLNASAPFDGCQNETIKNCTVTLDKTNPNGSFGIWSSHNIATSGTALTITAAGDLHSNNKIYGNTITNCTIAIWLLGFTDVTPYALYDQNNDVGGSSAATGNNITNIANVAGFNAFGIYLVNQNNVNAAYNTIAYFQGAGGTAVAYGIYFFGTNAIATATNNSIALGQAAGTGDVTGIYAQNTGAITATNNSISFADAGGSGAHYGVRTATATTANISTNTFTATNTGAVTGAYQFIYNASTGTGETYNNNIFNNINISTTGTTYLIYASNNTPNVTATGNNITGTFTRSGISGTMYGYYNFGSPGSGTATITGNNFSNIALAGSTALNGIFQATGTAQTELVNNNIISNISGGTTGTIIGVYHSYGAVGSSANNNTVSNISSAGIITGMSIGTSSAGLGGTYSGNNINGLSTTGASTVTGILHSAGTNPVFAKNKIYNLQSNSATGVVNGITIAAATTSATINNNLIGDLRAPSTSSATDAVRGINITGTTANSTLKIYYNSISLSAISTGANFSTSGLFHTFNTTATTASLDLRNNVIVNNSVPKGTGFTCALRRSAATNLNNYATTSNNNLLFAGGACTNRLIYYDGTNSYQTMTTFKAAVTPRETNSVSEDAPFISTNGALPTFLHMSAAISTQAESGGAPIATFTDDYDGDVRNATTPDIGADEFTGVAAAACSGTPTAGTITVTSSPMCANQTATLCLSGQSTTTGISVSWQSGPNGGPYVPIACAGGTCYNTGVLAPGTYYYVAVVTCANGGASAQTPQVAVVVNALPTININPPAPAICAGGSVGLTASGAVNYTWSPAGGLNTTIGSTVTASPAATTTYTVTGTDAIGCSNTGTVTVTVNPTPLAMATATPSVICSGGTSQLQAAGSQNFTTPQAASYVFSTATGTTLQNMTGSTILLGTGQDVASSGVTNIGFTFNFGGTNYTQFSASCNGVMGLGAVAVTSADGNNSTTVPSIVPCWDDMHTGTDGNVRYVLNNAGGPGFRILVVEWNYRNFGEASNFTKTVQVWLYEGTNQIKFVYGANTGAALVSATVGIVSAAGNFNDVNTSTNTNSTAAAQDANTVWPNPAGMTYIFTPPGAPTFSYLWSPATFLSSTTIANPVATGVTVTTTYSVTVTGGGCSSAPVNVTVSLPSALSAAVTSPTRCSATVTTPITATPTGGAPTFTYSWSPTTDLYTDAAGTVAYAGGFIAQATIYTKSIISTSYTVTIKDNCGTTANAISTVTFVTTPTASASSNSPICAGTSLNLTGTSTGGTSFNWAGPNSFSSTLQSPTIPSATTAASGTYTFTASTGGCASTPATTVVVVNPQPTISSVTATPSTICQGATSQLNVTASTNPVGYSIAAVPFTPIASGSGTLVYCNNGTAVIPMTVTTLDDGYWNGLALPFNFTYYGTSYSTFNIQSNGIISFSAFTTTTGYGNSPQMPNAAVPNNILGMLGDLDWRSGGQISTYTSGSSPNRIFVIDFNGSISGTGGGFYNSGNPPTALVNYQIQLFENGNRVQIHTTSITSDASHPHTMGIEDATGVNASVVTGRDNSLWSLTNDGVEFTPATLTYSWSPGGTLSSTTIANPIATPTSTTTYSVVVTQTNGCTTTGTVAVTVNVPPTVSNPSNTTVCLGAMATFTVTATGNPAPTYQWQLSTAGAGGPWNNLSNGAPYSGVTTATLTINPTTLAMNGYQYRVVVTGGPCAPTTATSSPAILTVNPVPDATATPSSQTVCSGVAINTIVLSGSVGGTVFNWTRDNVATVTGIAASGAGNISGTLTNTTFAPITVTFTITPTASGCPGTPITATVLVNPTPNAIATPSNQTVCSGAAITNIVLTGSVAGTTYTWTRDNNATVTGIAASGSGTPISGTLTNTTNAPITVTFTITPTANGCPGPTTTATVLVNPTPTAIATPSSQQECSGLPITTIVLSGAVTGTTYAWTRDNTVNAPGIAASGSGNISGTMTNNTGAPITVTFTITPTANGCPGTPITATVVVNSLPTWTETQVEPTTCVSPDGSITLTMTGPGGPYTFAWTGTGVNPTSQNQTGLTTGVYNVTVTVNATGCQSTASYTLLGPGGCFICPGIASLTTNPSGTSCTATNNTITASGLTNMGITYGITFKYSFGAPVADPYASGTLIATVPNGSLTAGGTVATTNMTFATAGTYYIYAIVSPTPVDPACRPSNVVVLTVNNTPTLTLGANPTVCSGSTSAPLPFTSTYTGPNGNIIVNGGFETGASAPWVVLSANPAPVISGTVSHTGTYSYALGSFGAETAGDASVYQTVTIPAEGGTLSYWYKPTTTDVIANDWQDAYIASSSGTILATVMHVCSNTNVWTQVSFNMAAYAGQTVRVEFLVHGNGAATPTNMYLDDVSINGPGGAPATYSITWNAPAPANGFTNVTNAPLPSSPTPITLVIPAAAAPGTYTGSITVTNGSGCSTTTPQTFSVTINPIPVVNQPASQVVCNGGATAAVNFTTPTTGPGTIVYNWSHSASGIGLANNGTGNIPSFTAINNTNAPVIATITVIPTYTFNGVSCVGQPKQFTITINPTPTVNAVTSQTVCAGAATAAVNFTGFVAGTVYNWTNSAPSIGLVAAGVGNIASFTAINNTNAPVIATITVTPSYTNAGVTCTGTPTTFTITVNPKPVMSAVANQTVCNGSPTAPVNFSSNTAAGNTTYAWTNNNTAIGLIAAGTGNIPSFIATNTTALPITGTITVTPTYTNGGVSCAGTPITFTITVNASPTVNPVPGNQVLCNGSSTAPITLNGPVSGAFYTWTNNQPSIGLASAGAGNIPSFTATNAGTAPVTATITVTGSFTTGGVTCTGPSVSFTITVNPTPSVNAIANQTVCNNTSTAAVTIAGPVPGTVFNWTNNNTSIGLAASGTGNIGAFTAINNTAAPVTATITVTPTFTANGISCSGTAVTFTITVNPKPTINGVANQVLCAGSATAAVTFSGSPVGTVYSWTNSNTAIGLPANGAGNIPSFTATNATNAPITGTITVTTTANACGGGSTSFTITVNPTATVNAVTNQTVCNGSSTAAITFGSNVAGSVFTWTNNNTTIGLGASGTGNIPSFVAINPTTSAVVATITVTATITANGLSCSGPSRTFTITVNPGANIILTNAPIRVCLTDTVVVLTATPTGGVWAGPGITGNTFNAATAGLGVKTISYTVANGSGCTATRFLDVTVQDCLERHNVLRGALRIYPNPSTGRFNIGFMTDIYKSFNLSVLDSKGAVIKNYSFTGLVYGSVIPIDLRNLSDGYYMLKAYNTQETASFSIIIGH